MIRGYTSINFYPAVKSQNGSGYQSNNPNRLQPYLNLLRSIDDSITMNETVNWCSVVPFRSKILKLKCTTAKLRSVMELAG